jgi:hypothetical protein
MSTLSSSTTTDTTTASQVRQSTTTSQPNNVISLPSFTLILGPLFTLSSNTGSLLSIENNIAIRTNTVSGLQYAFEYYLKNTLPFSMRGGRRQLIAEEEQIELLQRLH